MHFKKITLNNFRSFKHLEVELHPRLTVLVGENGAGKTTILDGIALAISPVLTFFSSANQRLSSRGFEDTDFRLEKIETKDKKLRWKAADYVQIIAETMDGLQWDVWKPSSSAISAPAKKYGQTDLKKRINLIQDSYSSALPALTPVFAYYGTRRGDIDMPERLRESKENYEYPTSALIGALDSKNDFKEFLKWFDREEASELRANKGIDENEYMPSNALDALRTTVSTLLGGGYESPYFNREHKFVVEPKDGGAPLLVTQLSQGYQSMIALGMDFARRLALANRHMNFEDSSTNSVISELGKNEDIEIEKLPDTAPLLAPAVMLVDEIDLHLHPIWQQKVLADLMRAFPNTQFVVTTHSPQVLTSVDKSCVRIIREEIDPNTGEVRSFAKGINFQTKGVASSDILFQIMGANPIPPVKEAGWFAEYTAKIENGTHEDEEGLSLRRRLADHFGLQHPLMLDAERLIRFQRFRLRATTRNQE